MEKQEVVTVREKKADHWTVFLKRIQSLRYLGGTLLANVLLVLSLASAPTVAYSTLAAMMPILFMGTHLADFKLWRTFKFELEKYVTSFPSATFMRDKVYVIATMCTMQIGETLAGKPVFLGTDKGMIHMVSLWFSLYGFIY